MRSQDRDHLRFGTSTNETGGQGYQMTAAPLQADVRTVDPWIDGQSVADPSAPRLTTDDPVTLAPTTSVALSSAAVVSQAVEAARAAGPAWSALAPVQRGRLLTAIGGLLRARGESFSPLNAPRPARR